MPLTRKAHQDKVARSGLEAVMDRKQQILFKEIKKALAYFHDPIFLRRHPLARLVPAGYLTAARGDPGLALAQLLQEGIERLRPAGEAETDRRWRPYHVLRYRYLEELSLQGTARQMGVSEREVQRMQGKALAGLADFIRGLVKAQDLISGSNPIPRLEHFVGRQVELDYYRRRLEREHLAVITGMAGMGKTALGAELASEWAGRGHVLWLDLQEGENASLEALLESLALSLAALDQDDYWYFLRANWPEATAISDVAKVQYLVSILSRGNYLLCFDSFHLASDNRSVNALCTELWRKGQSGSPSLLVIGRDMPEFAAGLFFSPLEGLSREDSRRLLVQAGLAALPENLFSELYRQTQGIPIFLHYFISWACGRGVEDSPEEITAFIRKMATEPDVKYYLLREVDNALTAAERRFLIAASAIPRPFEIGAEPVAELLTVEDAGQIELLALSLIRKHLLVHLDGERLAIPPLIREYFYWYLKSHPDEKRRVHSRMAAYYERAGNFMEAAYHSGEIQDYQAVARLLSENIGRLIDSGQGAGALQQLSQLSVAQVANRLLYQNVCLALGKLYHLRGRFEQALERYEIALASGGSPERLAEIYRQIGDVHMSKSAYGTARVYFQKGMALLGEGSKTAPLARLCYSAAMAELFLGNYNQALVSSLRSLTILEREGLRQELGDAYRSVGVIYLRLGDYAQALDYCHKSLVLQRELGHTRGIANALKELGGVKLYQADYEEAVQYFREAIDLYRRVRDISGLALGYNGMGAAAVLQGRYAQAARWLRRARNLMDRIGDVRGVAITLSNLGIVYKRHGSYRQAEGAYEQSLVLCEQIGHLPGLVAAFINLGTICYCRGNWEKALQYGYRGLALGEKIGGAYEAALLHNLVGIVLCAQENLPEALDHLEQAARLQERSKSKAALPDTYRAMAEAYLRKGDLARALEYGRLAVQVATAAGMEKEAGEAYRVLGEGEAARGELEQAERCFQTSIALLKEQGAVFELGQAYRSYGSFRQQQGQDRGEIEYLHQAEAIFHRIGAQKELEKVCGGLLTMSGHGD